ncbi:Gfo/Idh/MocA family protein [Paenibacillus psychroresistens]|nr:Gfo/Idh/MocA family oxidoreductase [Paenibacillus psychroresistens]
MVGAGIMGTLHARAYSRIQGAKLIGIVDSLQGAADKLANVWGVACYPTLEEMLAAEDSDVIDICLPTHQQKEHVLQAAAKGKHVFCEKLIVGSKQDALEMIEACSKAGVKFMVSHVQRFFPDYLKAKLLVDQMKLGKVGTVRMQREISLQDVSEDWYRAYVNFGDEILDSIRHDIDWLIWTFGYVERVYAKGRLGKEGLNTDHLFVSLRMKNGVIAHISGGRGLATGFRSFLEVAGRGGLMTMENDEASMPIMNTFKTENGIEYRNESPLGVSPYQLELQHFIDCIVNGQEPMISGYDVLRTLDVILAVQHSLETGKAITL